MKSEEKENICNNDNSPEAKGKSMTEKKKQGFSRWSLCLRIKKKRQ